MIDPTITMWGQSWTDASGRYRAYPRDGFVVTEKFIFDDPDEPCLDEGQWVEVSVTKHFSESDTVVDPDAFYTKLREWESDIEQDMSTAGDVKYFDIATGNFWPVKSDV